MKERNISVISRSPVKKGKTDWKRLREMTDEEIEKAIESDPDWADLRNIDWSKAELVLPVKKKAISIRLDEDVLQFFKKEGEGYQSRINAVLRSFVNEHIRKKRA